MKVLVTDPVFGAVIGERELHTHADDKCAGEFCVVHKPSDHHMVSWPLLWRADKGVMERICMHGVGHPDPDDLEYQGDTSLAVHGCDGCC